MLKGGVDSGLSTALRHNNNLSNELLERYFWNIWVDKQICCGYKYTQRMSSILPQFIIEVNVLLIFLEKKIGRERCLAERNLWAVSEDVISNVSDPFSWSKFLLYIFLFFFPSAKYVCTAAHLQPCLYHTALFVSAASEWSGIALQPGGSSMRVGKVADKGNFGCLSSRQIADLSSESITLCIISWTGNILPEPKREEGEGGWGRRKGGWGGGGWGG